MSNGFKFCGGCQQSLVEEAFNFKNKSKGILQAKCKTCSREYAKQHYACNRDAYIEKARVTTAGYRERNLFLAQQCLAGATCCGCAGTEELTFYTGGVDQGQPVYMAVHGGLSERAVMAAVDRSVVVCRKCLDTHFGKSLHEWSHLSQVERNALQARRVEAGFVATPRSFFKAYRAVHGSSGDSLCSAYVLETEG